MLEKAASIRFSLSGFFKREIAVRKSYFCSEAV